MAGERGFDPVVVLTLAKTINIELCPEQCSYKYWTDLTYSIPHPLFSFVLRPGCFYVLLFFKPVPVVLSTPVGLIVSVGSKPTWTT